jgi:hypothetical protein
MRARDAGSADGRSGRREAVGDWGLGKAGIGPCRCSPRATSAILTNRTPPLGSPFLASPSLNFRRMKKKADRGILLHFPLRKLSAFHLLCRKAIFCTLGELRQEVER